MGASTHENKNTEHFLKLSQIRTNTVRDCKLGGENTLISATCRSQLYLGSFIPFVTGGRNHESNK